MESIRHIGSVEVTVRVTPWGVVAFITPDVARALLVQNTKNRTLRRTRIELYSRDMYRWALNGETITFEPDGTIVDGQHRLEACVASDRPFETYIIGDISGLTRSTVGSGLTRTYGDVLGFEQEPDGRTLASVLSLCWKIEYNGTLNTGAGYPYPTHTDLSEYLERNPNIRASLSVATRASKDPGCPKSVAGGLHYLMACHSPLQADLFWEQVIEGLDLHPGDPAHLLRRAILGQANRTRRADTIDVTVWAIKAWNAYREGRTIKNLRWRRAGKNPERFPQVR